MMNISNELVQTTDSHSESHLQILRTKPTSFKNAGVIVSYWKVIFLIFIRFFSFCSLSFVLFSHLLSILFQIHHSLCVNPSFAHEVYYISGSQLNCLNVITGKIKKVQQFSFSPLSITLNEGYPPTFHTNNNFLSLIQQFKQQITILLA
jgi:hypothetical protein